MEWHIYFLFPAPVFAWRRWGHPASLALGSPLAVPAVFDAHHSVVTCPWYASLFASGMVAACPSPPGASAHRGRSAVLWAFAASATADLAWSSEYVRDDVLVGVATAVALRCLARPGHAPTRAAIRVMGSSPATFLGKISYSLYLIHYPILSLISGTMIERGVAPGLRMAVLLAAAVPLSIAVSYWFHLAFERPYLAARPGSSASPSPAPSSTEAARPPSLLPAPDKA